MLLCPMLCIHRKLSLAQSRVDIYLHPNKSSVLIRECIGLMFIRPAEELLVMEAR